MTPRGPGLDLGVSRLALAALLVFFLVHFMAICHMRGVDDPQGYVLNTSKFIPVNTYEDDAQVSIGHALGLFGPVKDTFTIATNFGGPLLHAAKPVMWAASALGIIKLSPDKYFYVSYPDELLRIWQVFAVYKLCILLLLPLSLYWIGRNFAGEAAGTVAAWLVAAMPYATAFELRLKPDGVVLTLTLLVVLNLLEFARSARNRNLYAAAVLLGLAFSMKFTLATAVFLFPPALAACWRRRGQPIFSKAHALVVGKAALASVVAFCLGNVRFLENPAIFLDFIFRYTAIPETTDVAKGFLPTFLFRIRHFEPFYGPALGALVIPACLYAVWRVIAARGRVTANTLLLLLFALNFLYLWKVAHNLVVLNLTYYYYSQAVLALALVALLLGRLLDAAANRPALRLACLAGVLALVGATLWQQKNVLAYLCGPSTRQTAHAWVADHLPKGASVGLPLPRDARLGSTGRYMVDPFAYRIVPLGPDFSGLGAVRPQFALTARMNPLEKTLADPAYARLVTIDDAGHLPREPYNFYQDDIYDAFRLRDGNAEKVPADGPGASEAALGAFLRGDPEPDFTVANVQALDLFPQSLDLLRKTPRTVLPLPGALFTAALRDPASPPTYLHQIPPEVLALWGVKYVLARDDAAFKDNVLAVPAYGLRRLDVPELAAFAGRIALFANDAYRGQVFFLPDPEPGSTRAAARRYLGLLARFRLKPYGELYPAKELAASGASLLRVRMTVSCTGPTDLVLKGGVRRTSVLLGPGMHAVDLPYAVDPTAATAPGAEGAGYELHPAAPGASAALLGVSAVPLAVLPQAQPEPATVDMRLAFARIRAGSPGQAVFALPWHPYWRAQVDGRETAAVPGPAGTVAVAVPAGDHDVAVRFAR